MPTIKKNQSAETDDTPSKRKRFLSKLIRPHRHPKKSAGNDPPAVVNLNKNNDNAPITSSTVTFSPQTTTSTKKSQTTKLKSSWLSRSKWFTKLSDSAFAVVDADGSGEVDEKELYSGLLLIHLKLGCYAGPAACRPVDRERVHVVFEKMDVDDSGSLDKEEFRQVMMVLCSNIFTRVLIQWSMTLIIVPLVAQYILNAMLFMNRTFWNIVTDLDEYSPVMDRIELAMESGRDWFVSKLPRLLVASYHKIAVLLRKVPESVWNTVPLTLLSCILGCLAVPYIIFKVDDYFQEMADKKKEHVQQES